MGLTFFVSGFESLSSLQLLIGFFMLFLEFSFDFTLLHVELRVQDSFKGCPFLLDELFIV